MSEIRYNKNVALTYPYYDPVLRPFLRERFDMEDVEDFEDMSVFIYQNEFLNLFYMTDENDSCGFIEPTDILSTIFQKMKNDKMSSIIEKVRDKHHLDSDMTEDDVFIYLFSYDYLFLTHKCVSDFLNSGEIKVDDLENLSRLVG